jgi:HSP20 family molecular chaperone IbpA
VSENPIKKRKDPFENFLKPIDSFFQEKPVKGFLQYIDELFQRSFPFSPSFPVDLSESEQEYIILAELPGVKKEQIKINVLENYVTIAVQSSEIILEEDDDRKIYRKQQSLQQSSRTIPLAYPVDEKSTKASYQNGVLKIVISKQKGKTILLDED